MVGQGVVDKPDALINCKFHWVNKNDWGFTSSKHSLIPLVPLDWHQSDVRAFFGTQLWCQPGSGFKLSACTISRCNCNFFGGKLRETSPSNAQNLKRNRCDGTPPIQVHVTAPKNRRWKPARWFAEQWSGENNPMLLLQQLLNIKKKKKKNTGKVITTEKSGRPPDERRIFPSQTRLVASAQTRPQESSGGSALGYLLQGQTRTFEMERFGAFSASLSDPLRELIQGTGM